MFPLCLLDVSVDCYVGPLCFQTFFKIFKVVDIQLSMSIKLNLENWMFGNHSVPPGQPLHEEAMNSEALTPWNAQ